MVFDMILGKILMEMESKNVSFLGSKLYESNRHLIQHFSRRLEGKSRPCQKKIT